MFTSSPSPSSSSSSSNQLNPTSSFFLARFQWCFLSSFSPSFTVVVQFNFLRPATCCIHECKHTRWMAVVIAKECLVEFTIIANTPAQELSIPHPLTEFASQCHIQSDISAISSSSPSDFTFYRLSVVFISSPVGGRLPVASNFNYNVEKIRVNRIPAHSQHKLITEQLVGQLLRLPLMKRVKQCRGIAVEDKKSNARQI